MQQFLKFGLRMAVAMFLGISQSAQAVPVTFEFTSSVVTSFNTSVSVGQEIQGSYTFDSNALGVFAVPGAKEYSNAVLDSSFSVIGSPFGGDGTGQRFSFDIQLREGFPPGVSAYEVVQNVVTTNGTGYFFLSLLNNTGGGVFTDPALPLPLTPPNLGDFDFARFNLFLDTGNVISDLTSFSLAPVPEPTTLILMGSGGLVCLAFRKRFPKKMRK